MSWKDSATLGEVIDRCLHHTEDCVQAFAAHEARVTAFVTRYPHYCRECQGWGVFTRPYDPSPSGVSLSAGFLVDVEPCSQCEGSELPHCALCGQIMTEAVGRLCTCPTEIGIPQPPECWCWERGA